MRIVSKGMVYSLHPWFFCVCFACSIQNGGVPNTKEDVFKVWKEFSSNVQIWFLFDWKTGCHWSITRREAVP